MEYKYYVKKVEALSCFCPQRKFDTFTRSWDLNGILTVIRFDILTSFWGPFQHLRPFSFNIWNLIGYLRPFSVFDTLLADIWDLFSYLKPFPAFDILWIQHLRPYLLFEAFYAFDTLLADMGDLIRYMRPFLAFDTHFIQPLRPYSLFEALFSIWNFFHSKFETLFVIWDRFQHLTPFWRTRPPIGNIYIISKGDFIH